MAAFGESAGKFLKTLNGGFGPFAAAETNRAETEPSLQALDTRPKNAKAALQGQ